MAPATTTAAIAITRMRTTLMQHWNHVFLFGMNDETLHTGFGPMCHYRFAVCTG